MRWFVASLLVLISSTADALNLKYEGKTYIFELPDHLCQAEEGPIYDFYMGTHSSSKVNDPVAVAEPCNLPKAVHEFAGFAFNKKLRMTNQLELNDWVIKFSLDDTWQDKEKRRVKQKFSRDVEGWALYSESEKQSTLVAISGHWTVFTTAISVDRKAFYANLYLSTVNFTDEEISRKADIFIDAITDIWVIEKLSD